MDLKLALKTALTTGCSKGIGGTTTEILAAEGCNVIIVSRSAESLAARLHFRPHPIPATVVTINAGLSAKAGTF